MIEVGRQYSMEREIGLMDAVHAALCHSFKILQTDGNVRLVVREPHRFACPLDREFPDFYTPLSMDCFIGRALAAQLTTARLQPAWNCQ
jgi:hypothetical protein